MKRVQIEDCQEIGKHSFINWDKLRNSTILITGATGLIGSNLVNAIAYNNQIKKLNIQLILPVRNTHAASERFNWTGAEIVEYHLGDKLYIDRQIDYIVHLASPTNSQFFLERPVDTLVVNFNGNKGLLDWAVDHPIKKYIELSSMEVYGFPEKGHHVKESELGSFETMSARNSYPLAKLSCEALCYGYFAQYKVPTVVLRATQTFGPGVQYSDGRVFAQFMRCAIEKKDIVLKTAGLTERSYLYTADAVSAIILCLLEAEAGQAYTVANPDTYCSIKEMAYLVAHNVAKDQIKVVFDITENFDNLGYARTLFMNLDVGKIKNLGWQPRVALIEMYERMIRGISENE